ncbi:hypothetical protein EF918_15545 [Streptomyces sp. WAC06614]|nr:hypothetical protein EF918_15545 [Streptomyces sp. WAC06614]
MHTSSHGHDPSHRTGDVHSYRAWALRSYADSRWGLRRSRYHGAAKTHLQHQFTAAAINLSRIDAWITETPRGSSRTSHFRRLRPPANPLTIECPPDISDSISPWHPTFLLDPCRPCRRTRQRC